MTALSGTPEIIDIDGVGLEVLRLPPNSESHGCGVEGPTIVFLHQGLGSVAMWRDFPSLVAKVTELSCVVYSRRGYGQSAPRAKAHGIDYKHREAMENLPKLLGALEIERPILFGHSDGGSMALIHAAHFPTAGLIVEAPHIFVEEICTSAIAKMRDMYEPMDFEAKLSRYHRDPAHAFWGWNDIWLEPAFAEWNIEDLLGQIDCPVLAIQGENDEYGTMAQLDGIALGTTGTVKLMKLPDCGHTPHREQPDRVLDAVKDFVVRLMPERTSI